MASLYSLAGADGGAFGDNTSTAGASLYSLGTDVDLGGSSAAASQALSIYSLSADDASLTYNPYAAGNGNSSILTQLGSIATGYLSRRVDVDLQSRMAATGMVGLNTDQRTLANYSTPQTKLAVSTTGGQRIDMTTLLIYGVIAFVVLKKVL